MPGGCVHRFRRALEWAGDGAVIPFIEADGANRGDIDGYRMEMVPEARLALIFNDDRPGVIGLLGTVFGDHRVNVADVGLSRRGETAPTVLKIDGDLPGAALDALRAAEPILPVRTVKLDG